MIGVYCLAPKFYDATSTVISSSWDLVHIRSHELETFQVDLKDRRRIGYRHRRRAFIAVRSHGAEYEPNHQIWRHTLRIATHRNERPKGKVRIVRNNVMINGSEHAFDTM